METEQEFRKIKRERDHYENEYLEEVRKRWAAEHDMRILEEHAERLEKTIEELKEKVGQFKENIEPLPEPGEVDFRGLFDDPSKTWAELGVSKTTEKPKRKRGRPRKSDSRKGGTPMTSTTLPKNESGLNLDQLIGSQPMDGFAFKREWLKEEIGASPDHLRLMSVTGDSMEPLIHTGDLILLDTSVNQVVDEPHIYCLLYNDRPIVKSCLKRGRDILIQSYNPEYPEIVVKPDEADKLKIVGKAVWMCRRLGRGCSQ